MKIFENTDWILSFLILVLFALGGLVLFSIQKELFYNQLTFFVIGLFIYFAVSNIDIKLYKNFDVFLYGILIFFLIIVLVFGQGIRGAKRWISLFGVRSQPSEILKPLLVLFFASTICKLGLNKIGNFLKILFLMIFPAVLVFLQPDLGNTVVIFFFWLVMILYNGIPKKSIFVSIIGLLFFFPVGWRFLKPYQKQRLENFFNPKSDVLGGGYNLIQSQIAVGAGGFLGRGLGKGTQSQLLFLPERQSDFIFACLSEELGFIGAGFLVVVYFLLLLKILLVSRKIDDCYSSLVLAGVFGMLFFQAFVNIGMNLGLLPITGLTLPLVSYGGSSMLATMVLLGLVQSVQKHSYKERGIEIK